jgi:hypothetical protein
MGAGCAGSPEARKAGTEGGETDAEAAGGERTEKTRRKEGGKGRRKRKEEKEGGKGRKRRGRGRWKACSFKPWP